LKIRHLIYNHDENNQEEATRAGRHALKRNFARVNKVNSAAHAAALESGIGRICLGDDRLEVGRRFCPRGGVQMSKLNRAISFQDDLSPVFEALSAWCREQKFGPDSLQGCAAASRLLDLFEDGFLTTLALLDAMRREAIR
jgi:hypothetical protein